MHSSLFSTALQNRLTAGLCHCNSTYGDLLFIQMCREPTEMHCSTDLGKMHSSLFSSALQNRLTAGLCHCNSTHGDLLFKHSPLLRCCSANQADSKAHVTAIMTMENYFSHRSALTQHQYTAGLILAQCVPRSSLLLCKPSGQQARFTAITPMNISSSYRRAVTDQQCITALILANCIPLSSLLLCRARCQQACVSVT